MKRRDDLFINYDDVQEESSFPDHFRILDASDINQLQRVYPKIVNEIKESFALLREQNCTWRMTKLEERRILKILSSIRPLLKVKNSIFLLRGLNPTLFSFLFEILPLSEEWAMINLPDSHYLMLHIAKFYAQTHEHFIANSDILHSSDSVQHPTQSSCSSSSLSGDNQIYSSKYFGKILITFSKLFRRFHLLTNQTQSTMVDWLNRVIGIIADQFRAILQVQEMFELRSNLLLGPFFYLYSFKSPDMRKILVKCMYKLQVFDLLLSEEMRSKKIAQQFILKLCNCAGELDSENFCIIWTRIPIIYLVRIFAMNYYAGPGFVLPIFGQAMIKMVQPFLGKMQLETFEFQLLADFLFERKSIAIYLLQTDSMKSNWVVSAGNFLYDNLFFLPIDKNNENDSVSRRSDNEEGDDFKQRWVYKTTTLQKWIFIISKFAQYCIVSRMKTPIGKTPLETFTKFEAELRSLTSAITSRAPLTNGKIFSTNYPPTRKEIPKDTNEYGRDDCSFPNSENPVEPIRRNQYVRQLRPEEEWFRVRMLSHCIDMIDKLMCYAVRGSMLKIADDIPLNARQFFTVNYNTCMDWLTRTTIPLMNVAFANGNYTQIVRLGGVLFAEFERKHPSTLHDVPIRLDSSTHYAICWVVRALIQLGASQAIRGVRMWAESIFGISHSFEWCKFAELLALARVEEALDGFLGILHSAQHSKENETKTNANEYYMLNVVEEMAMMAAEILRIPHFNSRIRESLKSIGSPTAKQLNKAEEFEKTSKHKLWEKVLSLSSWEQMVDSEPNNFNSIGLPRHKYCDIRDRFIDYEAAILNIYDIRQSVANTGAFKRLNISEALFSLQDELSSFAHFLLLGGCGKTDGFFHSKIATLHSLCTGIQHLSPHLYPHQKNFVQPFIKQMRSPTKQSGSTPILLELDLSDLLRQCKKDSLHRLSLAQSYCGWMHRLYGRQKEYSFLVRKMHQDVAKLAYDLGNPQLCAIHQRLANIDTLLPEEISSEEFNHSQFDILPEHHRPVVLPQFHMQQQNVVAIKSAPPGFAPILLQQPAVNVDFPVSKFETGVNSISQGLLSEDFDGDTLRLLANESAAMLQFGINICSEQGRHLEEIIGQCSTFEEFRAHVSNSFPITDISIITAAILTAIDQPAFSQLWLTIKHRQYRLYELALNSHLRFLENLFPGKSRIQTIEVILRLLKMLTRQSDWFERIAGGSDARERHGWMDRISMDVWTEVIPQLFACLNHPKPIVCDTIQLLLEKIGKHAPHSICYPAIVIVNEANEKGASLSDILLGSLLTRSRKRHENLVQQEDIDPLTSLRELKSIDNVIVSFKNIMELKNDGDMDDGRVSKLSIKMVECCKSLIRSLTIHYPEIVKDTMEFCRALQRIALLYEEQWFYVLTQFDHHLSRLMRSLPPITPRLDERLLKFLEKILISLKSLNSITCLTEPESENEKQFCQTYREIIQQALNTLEQNLNSNPPVAWEPFKKLIVLLNKQALKRSSLCLSIPKLSTYLGGFSAKMVPIPCQEMRKFGEMITVQKMAKLAFVLPTKTRPKKIALIGSDGKTYTFLFKGQENLYMDSRLMQFLRICNTIFNDLKNHHQMDMDPPYQCTSYSVTPLGSRSGLIEWVDGAIPLFQIYRKWRIRQLQFLNENEGNKQQKITIGLAKNPIPTEQFKGINKETRIDSMTKKTKELEPERPMEQFYHKLKTISALHRIPKEHLTDRKHWPKELVKQVVKELMEETSKDILAKEFWMHAGTSESWWIITQQFARTVAVSSMLGSLIGLGDRHLDNVLVNLVTGQIVHVDYNICFGKGRTLRVPETVPFRLTGNIVMALGPTKIDGTFRQSSERVLEMLRADKHVLRQLMETLKFDPMLDFNFLQNNMELRDKNQEEIADCLVHGMSRKLMGYELKYNNPPLSSRASPGLIKLDGKEPTEPEKEKHNVWIEKETTTVKEQVNLLVGEATDLSNLALMYEGWTAWV